MTEEIGSRDLKLFLQRYEQDSRCKGTKTIEYGKQREIKRGINLAAERGGLRGGITYDETNTSSYSCTVLLQPGDVHYFFVPVRVRKFRSRKTQWDYACQPDGHMEKYMYSYKVEVNGNVDSQASMKGLAQAIAKW